MARMMAPVSLSRFDVAIEQAEGNRRAHEWQGTPPERERAFGAAV